MKNPILILKQIFWLVLVLALLSGGCESESLEESKLGKIEILEVIVNEDYFPFEYLDEDGNPTGIAVNIIKNLFDQMELDYELKPVSWSEGIGKMENGQADAMFSMYQTEERKEYLVFPDEGYLADNQSLFARKGVDAEFDGNLESLKGLVVGTVRGYSYGEEFAEMVTSGIIETKESARTVDNVKMLIDGNIDLALESREAFIYHAAETGVVEQIRELDPPVNSEWCYVGFSPARFEEQDLNTVLERHDQIIREMKDDGTIEEIVQNYLDIRK